MDGTVNQRIAYFRKLKGYTQQEMAKILGMKMTTYSATEHRRKISCDFLIKVAEVLEVDPYYLLCGINHEETSVIVVNPKMPNTKNDEKIDMTAWERSHLTALNTLAKNKRMAIIKLTLLALNNRRLDIEDVLKNLEETPEIIKPY